MHSSTSLQEAIAVHRVYWRQVRQMATSLTGRNKKDSNEKHTDPNWLPANILVAIPGY